MVFIQNERFEYKLEVLEQNDIDRLKQSHELLVHGDMKFDSKMEFEVKKNILSYYISSYVRNRDIQYDKVTNSIKIFVPLKELNKFIPEIKKSLVVIVTKIEVVLPNSVEKTESNVFGYYEEEFLNIE